tara:strand:+ start:3597 stop:4193 length:597 start_codon:yes stop_codon:yes gene_type:complete
MSEEKKDVKPLSKKKRGYLLAIIGGTLGGPLGWFISPIVLYALNKKVKSKDGIPPNIFKIWSLVGLIGAPLSFGLAYLLFVEPEKKFDYLCRTYEDVMTEIETGRKLEMQSVRVYGKPKFTYFPEEGYVEQITFRKGENVKLQFPISKDGSLITWEDSRITRTFNLSNNILLEKFTGFDYETNTNWENVWKARCSLKD